tara:strand:+ start:199 stop:915 length:717 start_codon:yes stop_codon:yes gene_type:complete
VTGKLHNQVALVTGASRGIGAAVAKRFAIEGAQLILVARTKGGLEEVDDHIRHMVGGEYQATLLPLDLTDLHQIDLLGPTIAQRFGKLDIIVGNAGMLGDLTPVHQIESEVWEDVLNINLNANWRLIRTTDPLLRLSASGRAVFVTSGAAKGKRPYWGTYAVSKAALEMLVKCWAAETEQTDMKINLLDPGATRTAMRASAYPGEDPKTVKRPEKVTDFFVQLCSHDCVRHGEIVKAY